MKTTELRPLKVLFGIPSHGQWTAGFGVCALNMFGYFMHKPVPGYTSQTIIPNSVLGSILPRSRHRIVKAALSQQCTHVLFIDTDQKFPRDTLHRLLAHKQSIVAANVATKQVPAQPTARYRPPIGSIVPEPCYTDPSSHGLEEVWRVGTGVMLVQTDVFKRVGPGIFEIRYKPELDDYQGEDWSMVEAFEKAGATVWIDHDLSREVVHVGDMDYTHELVGEVRREEVAS